MFSQNIQNEIKYLLKITSNSPAILSVYLNMSGRNESSKKEILVFLKHALSQEKAKYKNNSETLESLEASHKELLKYLEEDFEPHFKGLAVFINTDIPLFIPFKSMIPFKNEYLCKKAPFLKQLIELSDEYEPTLLINVDSREAKIFKIVFGGFFSKEELINSVPGRYSMKGLEDMKWQHHFDFHLKEHAKNVASEITKIVDQEGFSALILSGQSRNLSFLKEELPKRIIEKISFENPMEKNIADQTTIDNALNLIKKRGKNAELNVVDSLITTAKSVGNGGVTGLRKTIDACNKGLIRKLVVADKLSEIGFVCPKCKSIFNSFHMSCSLCSTSLEEVDLSYALMARTKELDGEIEIIHSNSDLDKKEFVGAFLRSGNR